MSDAEDKAAIEDWVRQHHETPRLYEVKRGWAAAGNGWAVHGVSREDVLLLYRLAELRHGRLATNRREVQP